MNYNDRETLNLFYKAQEYGLPYFNDDRSVEMIKRLDERSFDDLVVIFALARPHLRPEAWEHYKSGVWIEEVGMPLFVQGLLARSSGLLIFQEQLIDILRAFTGWPREKAEEVRKQMGKKHRDNIESFYQDFVAESIRSPFAHRWIFESRPNGLSELWAYLIECAPYLISYKFSLSCTLHSYQLAYNLTHQ